MPILHMQTEAVRTTGQQINQASESLRQQAQQLRGRAQQLSNEWQGPSASMFEQEMQTLLQRAQQSAEVGVALNQKVQKEVDEWERVAAHLEGVSGLIGGIAGGTIGAIGGNAGSSGNPSTLDSQSQGLPDVSSEDLAVIDPHEVFTEEYMENMIGRTYQGGNSERLNELMEEFHGNQPPKYPLEGEMLEIVKEMAELRGESPEKFYEQYKKYVQLYNNQSGKPDINLGLHPDYLGSNVSLRYGQVVGDVFGIDPIFGSLLNPTGGLVGPDSRSYQPGENDAIGYHGVFHDAGGFLYNYHSNSDYKMGPGYNYLGRSDLFDTSSPIAGQVSGISWWASHPQLDVDILQNLPIDVPYVPDFMEKMILNSAEDRFLQPTITMIRQGAYVFEGTNDVTEGVANLFQGNFQEGANSAAKGVNTIVTGTARTIVESTLGEGAVKGVREVFSWF